MQKIINTSSHIQIGQRKKWLAVKNNLYEGTNIQFVNNNTLEDNDIDDKQVANFLEKCIKCSLPDESYNPALHQ